MGPMLLETLADLSDHFNAFLLLSQLVKIITLVLNSYSVNLDSPRLKKAIV